MVNTPGTTKDNLPKAINAKIMQRDEFHDATLKKLDAAKAEIQRLKAEYASLLQAYKKLEVTEQRTRDAYDRAMTDCVTLREENNALTAELAKANAELERLRESLSRIALLPEKWENEPAGIDPSGVMDCVRELRSAFSPAPTAEEKEKLECEKWVKTQPDITHESIAIAWRAWQAARGKEAK